MSEKVPQAPTENTSKTKLVVLCVLSVILALVGIGMIIYAELKLKQMTPTNSGMKNLLTTSGKWVFYSGIVLSSIGAILFILLLITIFFKK